jgi:hypothetical protein
VLRKLLHLENVDSARHGSTSLNTVGPNVSALAVLAARFTVQLPVADERETIADETGCYEHGTAAN